LGHNAVTARTHFDIADTAAAISASPDPKACSRIFQRAIATFGIDTFACGEVDLRVLERTVSYAVGWPEAWRKFYLESGLIRRDPLLDALKRRRGPFTWSELRREGTWPTVGTKGLQIIAVQGWTEGFAVPIPRGEQRFGLVSLYCKRRAFNAHEKSLLVMLSHFFHDRMRYLVPKHGFAMPPAGLTKREIETLRLIARGATDRDVANKMGISPSTAHEHFEKAKKKLRVSTRAEAVAIAVSLAIVIP
jgi:LuxR family transcriptional regulator, quorum-sensing system regulator BjaR1